MLLNSTQPVSARLLSILGVLILGVTACAEEDTIPLTDPNALVEEPEAEDGLSLPLTGEELDGPIMSELEARLIMEELYPEVPWDEEMMFGPQDDLSGVWHPAWMASAVVDMDVRQLVISAVDGTVLVDETLEGFAAPRVAARTLTNSTRYSQRDAAWKNEKLGKSTTDTIGAYGCVITTAAMWYANYLGKMETPKTVNDWGKANNCFQPGSSMVTVSCITDMYGNYTANTVALADLATTISTNRRPIFFYRLWGASDHMVYGYAYNGGSTTSSSSYNILDPWDGTSKSLSTYPTKSANNPYRSPS